MPAETAAILKFQTGPKKIFFYSMVMVTKALLASGSEQIWKVSNGVARTTTEFCRAMGIEPLDLRQQTAISRLRQRDFQQAGLPALQRVSRAENKKEMKNLLAMIGNEWNLPVNIDDA